MEFKGKAKRIDDIDLPKLGQLLGVGEDELHAFIDVETRGSGFDEQGRPVILFERHIFYRYLPPELRERAVRAGLASKVPGGYGRSSEQYPKLAKAMRIDRKAALYSCSWGLCQIMGFNHAVAGYDTVEDMVQAFMDDEEAHLQAAILFIQKNHLGDELRRHDWAGFARGYNGSNYRINNYDARLKAAFAKWSRIKDTPYDPKVVVVPPTKAQPDVMTVPATPTSPKVIVVEDNRPSTPKMPTKAKGLSVLAALLATLGAAVWEILERWF